MQPYRVTIRPEWPPCRQPAICTRTSPRVCGRTSDGVCRRFVNICELLSVNRGVRPLTPGRSTPSPRWTHTRDANCRTVRGLGAANERSCFSPCPRRRVTCPPSRRPVCVRARDTEQCKLLTGACQLRNNNCFTRPRNNWIEVDRRRCGKANVGDKPRACRPVPTVRPTARSSTTRRSTTTRRPTTRRSTRRTTRRTTTPSTDPETPTVRPTPRPTTLASS
ncbi:salivary glue protein Sgs-3-like [Scaptodrosophila lebanonensis]|uniref:Salivary glue protein Sgs-3-like n=1 Tax=Drosophila lebanonensis TaxID=7225 RepID=A0A6J2TX05_DROLE|nr:salivary glue protein Sgs-3-like [Scaptodrosophila lebanonensis]